MGSKGRGCSAVRVCRQGAERNAVVILPGRKSQRRVDRIRAEVRLGLRKVFLIRTASAVLPFVWFEKSISILLRSGLCLVSGPITIALQAASRLPLYNHYTLLHDFHPINHYTLLHDFHPITTAPHAASRLPPYNHFKLLHDFHPMNHYTQLHDFHPITIAVHAASRLPLRNHCSTRCFTTSTL